MVFVAGIDMGAKSTKVIIMDGERNVRGKSAIRTRPDFTAVSKDALRIALEQAGIKESDLNYVATTGFGTTQFSSKNAFTIVEQAPATVA